MTRTKNLPYINDRGLRLDATVVLQLVDIEALKDLEANALYII